MTTAHTPRQRRLMAATLAAPALLSAAAMCAVESLRATRPHSNLFTPPVVLSLAEAIERNDLDGAYAFIRHGQAVDAPIAVRDSAHTGGQTVLIQPLLWAVASRNGDAARMLLSFGAGTDRNLADALCLAEAIGDEAVAQVLRRHGAQRDRCGASPREGPPLLAFAEK